jgi:CTP synthase
VNNDYRDRLEAAGLVFSGTSPDERLVEFVELPRDVHPFFAGTQGHPELKSRPTRPHPLFRQFVRGALDYAAEERLPVELPGADGLPGDGLAGDGLPGADGRGERNHRSAPAPIAAGATA